MIEVRNLVLFVIQSYLHSCLSINKNITKNLIVNKRSYVDIHKI